MANLTAILTARDAAGLKARDYDRVVVYLTEQAHHSIVKALRIAGLGEAVLRTIPLDHRYRMRPDELDRAVILDRQAGLLPWLIVATAGTTDTGAVDPLEAISAVARQYQLWLHVDGAYGAFFALCQEGKQILKGMELSDSLTLDPHK
jgi:aromatic-L-amino-acid/L-tryptophan decarboxylase